MTDILLPLYLLPPIYLLVGAGMFIFTYSHEECREDFRSLPGRDRTILLLGFLLAWPTLLFPGEDE